MTTSIRTAFLTKFTVSIFLTRFYAASNGAICWRTYTGSCYWGNENNDNKNVNLLLSEPIHENELHIIDELNAIQIFLKLNKTILPGIASTHVWPHPLEQHFCVPSQSISCWHSCTQVPNPPSAAGQVPGLGSEKVLAFKRCSIKTRDEMWDWYYKWYYTHISHLY